MTTVLELRRRSAIESRVTEHLLDEFVAGDSFRIDAYIPAAEVGVAGAVASARATFKRNSADADPGLFQLVGAVVEPGDADTDALVRFTPNLVQSALLGIWACFDVQTWRADGGPTTDYRGRAKGRTQTTLGGGSPPLLTTIEVTGPASIERGATGQYAAQGFDQYGDPIAMGAGAWSTSDVTKATVNGAGLVTTVGPGAVEIRYTVGAVVGALPIVITLTLASITLAPDPLTIDEDGIQQQFVASGFNPHGVSVPLANNGVWSVDEAPQGSITQGGLFTSGDPGITEVRYVEGGFTGLADVTVESTVSDIHLALLAALEGAGMDVRGMFYVRSGVADAVAAAVVQAGGVASELQDYRGNVGFFPKLAQTDGTRQPAVVDAALKYLSFDGGNDCLASIATLLAELNGNYAMALVLCHDDGNDDWAGVIADSAGANRFMGSDKQAFLSGNDYRAGWFPGPVRIDTGIDAPAQGSTPLVFRVHFVEKSADTGYTSIGKGAQLNAAITPIAAGANYFILGNYAEGSGSHALVKIMGAVLLGTRTTAPVRALIVDHAMLLGAEEF